MGGKRWSKEEEEYFCEAWGMQPVQKIINHLKGEYGRNATRHALEEKAYRLGLESATINSNWITSAQMAEVLGLERTTVVKWFMKGIIKKNKQVLLKRARYFMSLHEFIKWLKNNQTRWDANKVELFALGEEPQWLKEKRKRDTKGFKKIINCAEKRNQKKALNTQTILEIQTKYKTGLTYKKLSEEYFVSLSTIFRYVKKYNISA